MEARGDINQYLRLYCEWRGEPDRDLWPCLLDEPSRLPLLDRLLDLFSRLCLRDLLLDLLLDLLRDDLYRTVGKRSQVCHKRISERARNVPNFKFIAKSWSMVSIWTLTFHPPNVCAKANNDPTNDSSKPECHHVAAQTYYYFWIHGSQEHTAENRPLVTAFLLKELKEYYCNVVIIHINLPLLYRCELHSRQWQIST